MGRTYHTCPPLPSHCLLSEAVPTHTYTLEKKFSEDRDSVAHLQHVLRLRSSLGVLVANSTSAPKKALDVRELVQNLMNHKGKFPSKEKFMHILK